MKFSSKASARLASFVLVLLAAQTPAQVRAEGLFQSYFKPSPKPVFGYVFLSDADTAEAMKVVRDIHEKYELDTVKPTPRKDLGESYVERFRVLTFSKWPNGGFSFSASILGHAYYSKYDQLNAAHRAEVSSLFRATRTLKAVKPYRGSCDTRGGYTEDLWNVPEPGEISLVCATARYRDGSGGDRCSIRVDDVDLNSKQIEIHDNHLNRLTELPCSKESYDITADHKKLMIDSFRMLSDQTI